MSRLATALLRIFNIIAVTFIVNMPIFISELGFIGRSLFYIIGILYFLFFNVFPNFKKYPSLRLRIMGDGTELMLTFFVSFIVSAPIAVMGFIDVWNGGTHVSGYIVYCLFLILGESVIFWNGIIRVYLTSVQLGIRYRVLGVALGLVPVANLVMLMILYVKTFKECRSETERDELNKSREDRQICKTKYPILLVHGVFFRDSKLLNYWGRVPNELIRNGATVYYGEQQSAASVESSGAELAEKIEKIVKETGCEKVNIIAHSKGGLDSRYAVGKLGCDKYTASLTTINTPHKGCIFAEYLLGKAPEGLAGAVEKTYNAAFKKLGDSNPDFMAAVKNLTNSFCEKFNKEVPDAEGVMYQSFGSKSARARSGRFPLNISYPMVKKFDGDNDGLVALTSAEWGERFTPIYPKGKRGITHADMIDLNRENFKGFDVREFYVQLVSELRERGF
ncbi:MAG: triacylglycerol lipase [Bacteroides sp.]|nr:triacylglycerol lipase [Bacteroides sp.]